ncbi:MAG TPA: FkbM family methyltransferase [Solirubrobacterales bacterium]|nr:FkbM family methyltransferase [Solirubrobacterales bacterium]
MRELFYRLAARFTPAIVVESHGLRYVMNTDDHGAGMTLFMGIDSDHRTLERVLGALQAAGVASPVGKTLIDVGANVGTTSVAALGTFGFERAVCFEPLPRNRELLGLNLAYNGLEERSTIFEVALSDRAGEVVFEIAPKNPSDGRVRVPGTDGGALGEEGWNTVEVPTATLDSFVESGEVDLDSVGLLWIDAQGHEGQIVAGAKTLIAKRVPLVIEFWPYGLRRSGGLEELVNTISFTYGKLLDLGKDPPEAPRPVADIARLADEYQGVTQTDLLLIP